MNVVSSIEEDNRSSTKLEQVPEVPLGHLRELWQLKIRELAFPHHFEKRSKSLNDLILTKDYVFRVDLAWGYLQW